MYIVGENYQKALSGEVISDSISGTVTLSDGTVLELSDETLAKDSLKITHELCGDYRIGTFNLGCLQMSMFDDSALLHDFSDAVVCPVYLIDTEDGTEEIPMGIYIADGGSVRRKRNVITFTAYDRGVLFDKVIDEPHRELTGTAAELIAAACTECGAVLGGIAQGLPNSSVTLTAASAQVQTYRDLVAWCAALLCGYAVIDREGALKIIPAKYSVSEQDSTHIITDKLLTEKERRHIYVTDTRAYIRTLNSYRSGEPVTYVSSAPPSEDEQAAPAVYLLRENPLLPEDISDARYDSVCQSWLNYIDGFKQRGINAEIYGDPALDVGDVLRCSGGDVDQRSSIVGMITKQEWRYRRFHTIICAAPELSAKTVASPAAAQTQLEKKLNAVGGKTYSGGTGIEINKKEIDLKPAQYVGGASYDEQKKRIGGVCIGSGLQVTGSGALSLNYASKGNYGGVTIGNGLKFTNSCGEMGVNAGKGLYIDQTGVTDRNSCKPVAVNIGRGLRFEQEEGTSPARYQLEPDLGAGLAFDEQGRIYSPSNGITVETGLVTLGTPVNGWSSVDGFADLAGRAVFVVLTELDRPERTWVYNRSANNEIVARKRGVAHGAFESEDGSYASGRLYFNVHGADARYGGSEYTTFYDRAEFSYFAVML